MLVLAILAISSVFVLAAIVGLADAFVQLVCWGAQRLAEPRAAAKAPQAPRHGITA